MTWYKIISTALQKGESCCQGNYCVSTQANEYTGGYESNVFYYGNKVFTYTLNPLKHAPHNESHSYDFCGYEGHSRTTKLICCCLEAIKANYRVKTVKGKVIEVPVTENTAKYNN